MQRHFEALVEVLVVHVVDAVHRMHIGPREPLHRGVELGEDLVIVEILARHRRRRRRDLLAGDFVTAAVDRVEEGLSGDSRARRRTASACRAAWLTRSRRCRSRRPRRDASDRRSHIAGTTCRG